MSDVTSQQPASPTTETSSPTTPQAPTTPEAPSIAAAATEQVAPVAEAFTPLEASAFKLPEGLTFADDDMNAFLGIINNQELSLQDRAQALIDLQAGLAMKSSEAGSQAWQTQMQNWQAEVQNDPELGGANYEKTIASVGRVMDKFATPEIRQAFDDTGAGNHPQIVRFLAALGNQFSEASPTQPGNPTNAGNQSTADRIFGTK